MGTVIRDSTVITMDDEVGVLRDAQVRIDGDKITHVGPDAACPPVGPQDEVVEARGFIVVPGLVNAHMHTWQTALRGMASNWTLTEYFRWMHAGLGTHYTPQDIGIATYAGAMNQINAGTTTLVDWCHNNPTPEHTDAAIDALVRSGIRAAFFHGTPKPDARQGERPFWELAHPRAEVRRLSQDRRLSGGGLLGLGMAVLGPHYSTLGVADADFRLAREFGLTASVHQGGGAARAPDGWPALEREGLLGPHINIVHGNGLSDAQLDRFVGLGMSFSLTPENEMIQGHGHPIIGRLRARGTAPSMGVDIESSLCGEMLQAARVALSHQRSLDNAAYRDATPATDTALSPIPPTSTVRTLEALRWVTVEGARMLGMSDRIGSLVPGKQADLVLVDARLTNMQPLHDPVNALVMQCGLSNIHSVMIAGRWKKRSGLLVDAAGRPLDAQAWLPALCESGRRLAVAVGWVPETGRTAA